MLMMPIAEARANFSSVMARVQKGKKIAITKGKAREPIAIIIPFSMKDEFPLKKRVAGSLAHWGLTDIVVQKMTDAEFLGVPESELEHLYEDGV